MSVPTKITWVNHASYVLETSNATLLTDPWFGGTAFDGAWALYAPTTIDEHLLRRITHLWISHEHPDHFSPASLRSIPAEVRANITVLYQVSRDRKVVNHCRRLGFAGVRELRSDVWVELADDLRVMCNRWRLGDSYLVAETPSGVVLNVNDCVIRTSREAEAILDDLGGRSPDVLVTQYAYANRVGNPDQTGLRQAAARAELESVGRQVSVFKPKYVIQSAGFVWFCHRENNYMNDALTTATDSVVFIRENTDAVPVVLYPGETWSLGDEPEPADLSAGRYDADLERCIRSADQVVGGIPISVERLVESGRCFAEDLRSANGNVRLAALGRLGMLGPVSLWATDLNRRLSLSWRGVEPVPGPADGCDVALSSEALHFVLNHRFGGMTLFSGARFRAPASGRLKRMLPLVNLRDANNRGDGIARWVGGGLMARAERALPAGSGLARWIRRHF